HPGRFIASVFHFCPAAWNRAMPLPVADEGIAGFLQRSENRRISVSPNDSPGTARRVRFSQASRRRPRTPNRYTHPP
nr:hypothetical protein [Clostridia bacterium]